MRSVTSRKMITPPLVPPRLSSSGRPLTRNIHAVRPVVVAYEHIHFIHRLAVTDDAEERQILHSHGRFSIGIEKAVSLDPLLRGTIRYVHADDLFGRGIYVKGLPRYIGDDDAVSDTIEHGFHQLALLAQFFPWFSLIPRPPLFAW